jgi:hypothetical protein
MSTEECQPHETYGEAYMSTMVEIIGNLAVFERCDLENLIKQATQEKENE